MAFSLNIKSPQNKMKRWSLAFIAETTLLKFRWRRQKGTHVISALCFNSIVLVLFVAVSLPKIDCIDLNLFLRRAFLPDQVKCPLTYFLIITIKLISQHHACIDSLAHHKFSVAHCSSEVSRQGFVNFIFSHAREMMNISFSSFSKKVFYSQQNATGFDRQHVAPRVRVMGSL